MQVLIFSILTILISASSARAQSQTQLPLVDLPDGKDGTTVRYGYELLANTPEYLGSKGKIKKLTSSRLACRNCHLDVGARPSGNSWLDAHGLYPQYRAREGRVQTLADRTNACFKHNLQSKPLPVDGPEMNAILRYYRWLGRGRPALLKDPDNRLPPLELLSRAADVAAGEKIFGAKCMRCHGSNGEGQLRADGVAYLYPPLWGKESFVDGSSMSRLSMMARFVKANMPFGVTADKPELSNEEAWDVSAFVLSHGRPKWNGKKVFSSLGDKPFDYPFGPYADEFPLEQHKIGPFLPVIDHWRKLQGPRASEPTTSI
ncbi:MAG: c-type cytochrome [Bdellovibrionota bacterium]